MKKKLKKNKDINKKIIIKKREAEKRLLITRESNKDKTEKQEE